MDRLPAELVTMIFEVIHNDRLLDPQTRLISKQFDEVVAPLVFSRMTLKRRSREEGVVEDSSDSEDDYFRGEKVVPATALLCPAYRPTFDCASAMHRVAAYMFKYTKHLRIHCRVRYQIKALLPARFSRLESITFVGWPRLFGSTPGLTNRFSHLKITVERLHATQYQLQELDDLPTGSLKSLKLGGFCQAEESRHNMFVPLQQLLASNPQLEVLHLNDLKSIWSSHPSSNNPKPVGKLPAIRELVLNGYACPDFFDLVRQSWDWSRIRFLRLTEIDILSLFDGLPLKRLATLQTFITDCHRRYDIAFQQSGTALLNELFAACRSLGCVHLIGLNLEGACLSALKRHTNSLYELDLRNFSTINEYGKVHRYHLSERQIASLAQGWTNLTDLTLDVELVQMAAENLDRWCDNLAEARNLRRLTVYIKPFIYHRPSSKEPNPLGTWVQRLLVGKQGVCFERITIRFRRCRANIDELMTNPIRDFWTCILKAGWHDDAVGLSALTQKVPDGRAFISFGLGGWEVKISRDAYTSPVRDRLHSCKNSDESVKRDFKLLFRE